MTPESSGFWDDIVPSVDPERCQRCADCAASVVCLAQSLRRDDPDRVPVVDVGLCFGCYSCACPHGAIKLPRSRKSGQ